MPGLRLLSCHLFGAIAPELSKRVPLEVVEAFRDQLFEHLGSPKDPMARLFIDQLVLMHFSAARMHSRSANSNDVRASTAFADTAVRLTREFRRSYTPLPPDPCRSRRSRPTASALPRQDALPARHPVSLLTAEPIAEIRFADDKAGKHSRRYYVVAEFDERASLPPQCLTRRISGEVIDRVD